MLGKSLSSFARTLDCAKVGFGALTEALVGPLGQSFPKVVKLIHSSSGRVIVSGLGKSGHIARKIAATLSSTGTQAYFVHPTEANHGDLGMIGRDDVVLALSWSGESSEMAGLLTYCNRFRVPIIAVTSKLDSTLARAATDVLLVPTVPEACPHGLAPTTSTTLQLVIGDALAIALLEARGFSSSDFKYLHPGGRLGAQLKRVSDLMSTGEGVPLLPIGSLMSNAIVEISARGFGVLGLLASCGDLVGIITDGDLRRHMTPHLLQLKVEDVMTKGPQVVAEDTMASEALAVMQERKISVLFVVRERRPVGILHIQDILRAGLI